MRLLKELPEIEEKITDRSISLNHLSIARSVFKQELNGGKELSRNEKLSLIGKLENTSKREAEKIAVSMCSNPEALKIRESVRAVTINEQLSRCLELRKWRRISDIEREKEKA